MNAPRFTIIIPAYNVEGIISNTIASLVAFLTDEFELICVNDGSTDNTAGRIEAALKNAKCRAYRVDTVNSGVSAARNEGLKRARGEYITFVDGDDLVMPNYGETLIELTRERKPDIAFFSTTSDHTHDHISGNTMLGISGEEAICRTYENKEFSARIFAAAYKREFIEREGLRFTPGCGRAEDDEFIQKALVCARCVDVYPIQLYVYLLRKTSIMNTYRHTWFDGVDAKLRALDFAREKGASDRTLKTFALSAMYSFFRLRASAMHIGKMSARTLVREIRRYYPGQYKKTLDYAVKYLPPFDINRISLYAYRAWPSLFFALLRVARPEYFT